MNLTLLGYSNHFIARDGTITDAKTGKIVEPITNMTGIVTVALVDDEGIWRRWKVSDLLAIVYIQNPRRHVFVSHKDGNRLNNSLLNLEWTDRLFIDGYPGKIIDLDKVEYDKDLDESLKHLVLVAQAYYYTSDVTLFTDSTYDYLADLLRDRTGLSWGQGGVGWDPHGRTRRLIRDAMNTVEEFLKTQRLKFVKIKHVYDEWALYDEASQSYPRYAYEKQPSGHTDHDDLETQQPRSSYEKLEP